MAKRYVLLIADGDLSKDDRKDLRAVVERRYHGSKLIELESNARAVILKTTNLVAPSLRSPEGSLAIGGKRLSPVLTSGAVGNLKRRASEAGANGQVHE
jgi:hypothetical protein